MSIEEYAEKKYPSRFKGKKIEVEDIGIGYKVFTKDVSPVFLSYNYEQS